MSGPRYDLVPPKGGWPEAAQVAAPAAPPPPPAPEATPYNMADEQATFYGWRERERELLRSQLAGEQPPDFDALKRRANWRWHGGMATTAVCLLATGLCIRWSACWCGGASSRSSGAIRCEPRSAGRSPGVSHAVFYRSNCGELP